MLIDSEELEKEVMKELDEYKDWIVDIPKTQKEFNERFSLKNDEINIDKIDFKEINLENISGLMVDMPVTQCEFNKRFNI